jgi:cytidine deaminase
MSESALVFPLLFVLLLSSALSGCTAPSGDQGAPAPASTGPVLPAALGLPPSDRGIQYTGISAGDVSDEDLIRYSIEAQNYSYSPYSHLRVGAALLTADGKVYTGTNVENAAYGLSNCAERTAVFKAVSEGSRNFSAIAITSSGGGFTYPCGMCRQVLYEFGPDIRVIVFNGTVKRVTTVRELLPDAFGLVIPTAVIAPVTISGGEMPVQSAVVSDARGVA